MRLKKNGWRKRRSDGKYRRPGRVNNAIRELLQDVVAFQLNATVASTRSRRGRRSHNKISHVFFVGGASRGDSLRAEIPDRPTHAYYTFSNNPCRKK